MENFKFVLFSIFILGLLGFAGYWAFTTIESGSTHVSNQEQKQLKLKNEELLKEVSALKKQIIIFEAQKEEQDKKAEEQKALDAKNTETVPAVPTPTKTTVLKYQSLIDELQKMVNNNIYLKNKSTGAYVGSVQKFLNIYNNTSNKIDNDYGASTITAVKNYQKSQGLMADGEAGPATFKKMITWLKSK
jgi:murein L,D-transpeptidase YcbB/YkuD